MKKYIFEHDELKTLLEGLKEFNNSQNHIKIVFGSDSCNGDKFPCMARIIDGGNMIKKGFYSKMPDDYDGTSASAEINVKAIDFINFANALLAYDEDITFSISESSLEMSAGNKATIPLPLSDCAEPSLPYDIRAAFIALQIKTASFFDFLRKGCFLYDESDVRNISDRVVIQFNTENGGKIKGHSMVDAAFANSVLHLGSNADGSNNDVVP